LIGMTVLRILAAAWFLAAASPVLADEPCPMPEALRLHDIRLPASRAAWVQQHRLVILTLGGALTAGKFMNDPAATYPARLQAELRAELGAESITVINMAKPGNTAADISPSLPDVLVQTGANLVIWGPGGRDVALRLDQREFQRAVDDGIVATRGAGADLLLMDMTYLPSPTRMALVAPYRDRLRRSAEENHVPFLPRHDLMHLWADDRTLDLDARTDADRAQVARRLLSCMAQSLAAPIAAAVR